MERLAEEERLRREEEERARRRKEAEAEAERLLQVLSKLEEEEAERLRAEAAANVKEEKPTMDKFEHCAFGDMDLMGLSEEELDTQCDELFKTAPIDFVPRDGNQIDMAIDELIRS